MKTLPSLAVTLVLLSFVALPLSSVRAQGTAFTYQGRLNSGTAPAAGLYDFRFKLYYDPLGNTQAGGSYVTNGIGVTNGLFLTTLDFGPGIFTGTNLWLEIDVKTNGGSGYTVLSPFQAVTPTPYAIFASTADNLNGTVPAADFSGTYSNVVTLDNLNNSFSGNGAGLTNVNATTLNGLEAANFWQTGGNAGTTPGANFVGTTDNQALELHVNSRRGLRLEPTADNVNVVGAINVINGSPANIVVAGVQGATIGGGGASTYFGGGVSNVVASSYGTIGGGVGNEIQTNSYESTIGGGNAIVIYPGSFRSAIGGGWYNQIEANSFSSAIAGGYDNIIDTNSSYSSIVGGGINYIGPNASFAFVGGGIYNNNLASAGVIAGGQYNTNTGFAATVSGGIKNSVTALYATIGGGYENTNAADYAVVAGGIQNTAGGYESVVSGGGQNTANGNGATVSGGNENTVSGNSSTIVGGVFNSVTTNFAIVGGGGGNVASGSASFVGGGGIYEAGGGGFSRYGNTAGGAASVVGGGLANQALGNGSFIGGGGFDGVDVAGNFTLGKASVIGGGLGNSISGNGIYATIGGGYNNVANNNYGTVAGGVQNTNQGAYATMGGGSDNNISGSFGTVSGGLDNTVNNNYGTVPGGFGNMASGLYSFAAGYNAQALNEGSFVWSDDSSGTAFTSTANDQFAIRAAGGVVMNVAASVGLHPAAVQINSTGTAAVGLAVGEGSSDSATVFVNTGSGDIIKGFSGSSGGNLVFEVKNNGTVNVNGIALTSDRNAKEHFAPLSPQTILAKVAALPLTEWNYKNDAPAVRHMGPMAQDFHAAFNLNGSDEKHISVVDESGVALAAIQGLNEKLEARSQTLETENAELKARLEKLEKLVGQLTVSAR
jgi:hypothetical protein